MTEALAAGAIIERPPVRSASGERWTHLDGLRGLAAVSVVLCHFVFAFQPAFLNADPAQGAFAASTGLAMTPAVLFWNPDLPVAVFFVLSGFVLSLASAGPAAAGRSGPALRLAGQLVRRWVRLGLPILGSSLLIWAVLEAGSLHIKAVGELMGSDWIKDMTKQYDWLSWLPNSLPRLFRQSLFDVFVFRAHIWNPVLWTMPIEFAGSVGVFVFYALLRGADFRIRVAALLAAAAALAGTNYIGFAAGALLWEGQPFWRGGRRVAWAGGAALLPAVVLGGMPSELLGTPYWPFFVFASAHLTEPVTEAHRAGAILLVFAALTLPPLRAALDGRVPQALGRASFMVYLCHVILLCTLTSWIILRMTPVVGYDLATLAALAATLLALAPVAVCMTRLADAPAIRASHWAERRILAWGAGGVARALARRTRGLTGQA